METKSMHLSSGDERFELSVHYAGKGQWSWQSECRHTLGERKELETPETSQDESQEEEQKRGQIAFEALDLSDLGQERGQRSEAKPLATLYTVLLVHWLGTLQELTQLRRQACCVPIREPEDRSTTV